MKNKTLIVLVFTIIAVFICITIDLYFKEIREYKFMSVLTFFTGLGIGMLITAYEDGEFKDIF